MTSIHPPVWWNGPLGPLTTGRDLCGVGLPLLDQVGLIRHDASLPAGRTGARLEPGARLDRDVRLSNGRPAAARHLKVAASRAVVH